MSAVRFLAATAALASSAAAAQSADAMPLDVTRQAHFGSALTLRGFDERMRVRPVDLFNVSAGEFFEPRDGYKYVGVQLKLHNVGTSTYSDSPTNGAALVSRGGRVLDATILVDGTANRLARCACLLVSGAERVCRSRCARA